jgi:hypothetical protein
MEFSNSSRPFPCSLCKLAFKSKQFLQRHMASHSDAREFSCHFCEKTYKYKKGVNRHIKKFHNFGDFDLIKPLKKHFKVEDFLDLAKDEKYRPVWVWDYDKGREIKVLFDFRDREAKFV